MTVEKEKDREASLKRLREFRGRLPVDFKLDHDEANARLPYDLPFDRGGHEQPKDASR